MNIQDLVQQAYKYNVDKNDAMVYIRDYNEHDICHIDRLGFVIFSPDAFENNHVACVINDLNIIVLKYKIVFIPEFTAEQLYENELFTGKINAWWIKKEIFSKGKSLVILCTVPDIPKEQNICQYLVQKKGNADPLCTDISSVRGKYRVTSKAFGFMHSSDDGFSLIKEASCFFSVDEIKEAIKEAITVKHRKKEIIYKSYKQQQARINFYEVLFGIKKEIWNFFENEGIIKHSANLDIIYKEAQDIIENNYTVAEEREKMHIVLKKEFELVNSFRERVIILIRDRFNSAKSLYIMRLISYFRLLKNLSNELEFSKVNLEELVNDLRICNISLDKWEFLLIRASLFFY